MKEVYNMENNILLENYLKQLKLPTFIKEYRRAARQCAQEKRGFEPFLQQLTELEIQQRRIRTMQRRIKEASFPAEKELADFDFTASNFEQKTNHRFSQRRLYSKARMRCNDWPARNRQNSSCHIAGP